MTSFHLKQIVAGAVVCGASFGAHAALTTLTVADGWPPLGSSGLAGVLFNVDTGDGLRVATGAHNYKEGTSMANNGVDTFYANPGFSPNPPTTAARWAFDYVIDYRTGMAGTTLANYVTTFSFDVDPTDMVSYRSYSFSATNCSNIPIAGGGTVNICGLSLWADSQNPVFVYAQLALLGSGFSFNPSSTGNFAFNVSVMPATGGNTALADSTINVNVPEPTSLALVGLALAGAGFARRRRA